MSELHFLARGSEYTQDSMSYRSNECENRGNSDTDPAGMRPWDATSGPWPSFYRWRVGCEQRDESRRGPLTLRCYLLALTFFYTGDVCRGCHVWCLLLILLSNFRRLHDVYLLALCGTRVGIHFPQPGTVYTIVGILPTAPYVNVQISGKTNTEPVLV